MEIQTIDFQSRSIDWFLYGAIFLLKEIFRGVSRARSGVRGRVSRMFNWFLNTPVFPNKLQFLNKEAELN